MDNNGWREKIYNIIRRYSSGSIESWAWDCADTIQHEIHTATKQTIKKSVLAFLDTLDTMGRVRQGLGSEEIVVSRSDIENAKKSIQSWADKETTE